MWTYTATTINNQYFTIQPNAFAQRYSTAAVSLTRPLLSLFPALLYFLLGSL